MSPLMVEIVVSYVYSAVAPLLFLYAKSSGVEITWNASGVMWSACTVICAIIAQVALLLALRTGDVGTVNVMVSAYPILTCVLGIAVLGESFSVAKIVGVCLVMCGLGLISR